MHKSAFHSADDDDDDGDSLRIFHSNSPDTLQPSPVSVSPQSPPLPQTDSSVTDLQPTLV